MNFGNENDSNLDGIAHGACNFDDTALKQNWDLVVTEWEDAILAVPGAEYLDEISEEWSTMFDENGESELDEEMNSFFDEAFNGLDESFDFDTGL